jgi:hypothetical protein
LIVQGLKNYMVLSQSAAKVALKIRFSAIEWDSTASINNACMH